MAVKIIIALIFFVIGIVWGVGIGMKLQAWAFKHKYLHKRFCDFTERGNG